MKTEPTVKLFSAKGAAMMQECKRLLNRETPERGLLFAAPRARHREPASVNAFLVAPAAGAEGAAPSGVVIGKLMGALGFNPLSGALLHEILP